MQKCNEFSSRASQSPLLWYVFHFPCSVESLVLSVSLWLFSTVYYRGSGNSLPIEPNRKANELHQSVL